MYSSLQRAQAVFEVLQPGLQTTVQDGGRWGYRAVGVPTAGALDRFALQAANMLVGNEPDAAVLEVLLTGLAVRVLKATTIAITGAKLGALLDGIRLAAWTAYTITTGQRLAFTRRDSGARAYVGVAGGIAVEPVLGSRSTYLAGGWGGLGGRALRAGDVVEAYETPPVPLRWLAPEYRPRYSAMPALRCIMGPHWPLFSDDAQQTWQRTAYSLSGECDRMGYRLEGAALEANAATLASCGVLPGVVQVPPAQSPILLMADGQTTGGYPIIGTVIGADLPLAAQLIPGDRLTFQLVSQETARTALQEQQRWLELPQDIVVEGGAV